MTPRRSGRKAEGIAFVGTLGALSAVTATAIDISIPAHGEVAAEFGLPASAGAALVTAFMLAYGPGQLVWGMLADRFGRRTVMFVSLAGFLVASAVCATTESFAALLIARAVQGMMAGGAPVAARAVARDMGGGLKTANLLAVMTIILGLAPLLAPLVGSGLLVLFDWRSVFWFLLVFGVAAAAATCAFIPETQDPAHRQALSLSRAARNIRFLLGTHDFVFGSALGATSFAGYAAFLAVGAAMAQERFGVSPEGFGPLFAIAAAAFVLGSILVRRMIPRFGLAAALRTGVAIAVAASVPLLITVHMDLGLVAFWAILCLYVSSFGLLMPGSIAQALEPAGAMAGFGASVFGVFTALGGALGAHVSSLPLFETASDGLVWTMGEAGFACLAIHLLACATRPQA
ncbi:MAG: Bcr/CflA family efflux MFS transporter [Rhodospirillaceae bacterium]|jgi:MFS transporter, DHA1 family, multidrug resistance protein|nr:Bcr/CflA family efflux MFS transporter [Rhodospirillaceae bacterium]MBT6117953.1 Bcr/CflA family efflux MFS transporter [Rhodospirillaceae bacterium]